MLSNRTNRDYAPALFNTQDNRRIIVFSITERGNAPAVVQLSRQYTEQCFPHHRRRKRGGPGGPGPRNNLRGGANIPFGPPNNPSIFSFNFYEKQEKNHKCTKLKVKIIINATVI